VYSRMAIQCERLTMRGRKARLRRVTFNVFAQFLCFHTMNVCFNF
jgi:hypothetical protein